MGALLLYAGIFLVCCFTAALLIVIPNVVARIGKKKVSKGTEATLGCLMMVASPLLAFIALSFFHVYPPRLFERPQAFNEKNVDAVDQLGQELLTKFAQPERLTIEQLRELIGKVREYTSQATALNRTQETQISQLRQIAEDESKKAKEAQELARTVKSLTGEQLDAVKFLITKDASQQSKQSFIIGAIISFPIGFLSSMLAAWFYERLRSKSAKVVRKVEDAILAPVPQSRPAAESEK